MKFSSFQYTKKNGEMKNYFILKREKNEEYVEGIVLSNLEDEEIEDLIEKYFKFEVANKEIELEAQKLNMSVEDYLENNPDEKEKSKNNYEDIKPYIKKAYRKFIASNITIKPNMTEELKQNVKESIIADISTNKE
jgi:hypothetical protein